MCTNEQISRLLHSGIRKEKFIFDDGFVSAATYLPDERTADKRQDGGLETSINWEDDLGAVDFTLEFRDENNNYAHPNGVVRLPRQEIDHINTLESTHNTLSYERDQLPNNHYHGNLVFRGDLPKPRQRMIASVLASASSNIIQRI